MNKTELVKALATKANVTQANACAVLEALPEVIKEEVVKGEKILLSGFATFDKAHTASRSGTTTLGGSNKAWTVPERDEIRVKLSKNYKVLNGE